MSDQMIPIAIDATFPRSLVEFSAQFGEEDACEEVLRRWKYGDEHFRCPGCRGTRAWWLASRLLDECTTCGRQVSLTAGTVMHGTRKPLRLWFLAIFLFVRSKQGISAAQLQQDLELGSYQTAWAWLHKLRWAVNQRATTQLSGVVEADETWEGGHEDGCAGRPVAGVKKDLVAAAVEVSGRRPGKWGRVRLALIANGSSEEIEKFLAEHVERGTTLLTDGWVSYVMPAKHLELKHIPVNISKSKHRAHEHLPAVHRVFSLLHRVLDTTHQGAVRRKHLQSYLAEFEYRFNRRKAKSRGLLFQRALDAAARRAGPYYWEIVGRVDAKTPLRASA